MRGLLLIGVLVFALPSSASAWTWLDEDTTPPVLSVPGPVSAETENPTGAIVSYPEPTATDDVDPAPVVTCNHHSGDFFAVGETGVTCRAEDASGNRSHPGSFTVTVTLVDHTAPVLTVPGPISEETENPAGKSVSYQVSATDNIDPSPSIDCDHPSGSTFPLGTTTVTCTAHDAAGNPSPPGSFTVTLTLVDHTGPVITTPGPISEETENPAGRTVTFAEPTATDNLDPSPSLECDAHSGDFFLVGQRTVSCTASDATGNTTTASFTVTVSLVDHTDPVLTVPGPITEETESPAGKTVAYTATASDNLDPNPTVTCNPNSGSTFPLGPSTVTCTATDNGGNSDTESFTVTINLVDHTDPVLTVPGPITEETENPGGKTVAYTATASDNLDPNPIVTCNPNSGSAFPVGPTTVTCTATDASGNDDTKSFTVTVVLVDHTTPTLHNLPGAILREANGPLGSIVSYTPPTATDNLDEGPLLVTCNPPPGSTFALGTTSVTCTATDSHLNNGVATFSVVVVDTTKPVLTPPGDRNLYATTPTGIPRDDPAVTAFLSGGSASDIVDQSLSIGNNAPAFLPVGTTIVTFATADDSGNRAEGTAALTVFPMPAAGTTPTPLPQPPGRTPPDDVTNLKAKAGSRQVTLSWTRPTAADFDHVTITRTLGDGGASTVVYTGNATSYVDKGLQNEIEYRYTVVSYDKGGDRSAGAVVVAVPKPLLLLTPRDGARVKRAKIKTLRLSWARMPGADYYNVQLYFAPAGVKALTSTVPAQTQAEAKVLSVWPKKTFFVLKKTWKFSRVRYRLKPGLYRWYIWPGYGSRKEVDYGPLMGSSTFVVVP